MLITLVLNIITIRMFMKILMVCLGNICRSPLAEGIMKREIDQRKLDWQVDSAGTGGWHVGEQPDSRSIEIAQKNGIDITQQRSQKLQASDLDKYDLILAMDTSNYQDILRLANTPTQRNKVKMIMNYVNPNHNESIPDPYYNDGFPKVYAMLTKACKGIVVQLTDQSLNS